MNHMTDEDCVYDPTDDRDYEQELEDYYDHLAEDADESRDRWE